MEADGGGQYISEVRLSAQMGNAQMTTMLMETDPLDDSTPRWMTKDPPTPGPRLSAPFQVPNLCHCQILAMCRFLKF